jgi:hypothetical protein
MRADLAGRNLDVPFTYSALTAAAVLLARLVDVRELTRAWLCPFRELTGLPCPFCGGVHALYYLSRGQWREAAAANPLVCVLIGALLVSPMAVVLARKGMRGGSRKEERLPRRLVWIVVGLVLGNWVYLTLKP